MTSSAGQPSKQVQRHGTLALANPTVISESVSMFKNKPKKLSGKNFKYEETVYELSKGKGVGDEAEIALTFHQGGTTASYYGRALNRDDIYVYSVDGIPGTFERIADAMAAIEAAHAAG